MPLNQLARTYGLEPEGTRFQSPLLRSLLVVGPYRGIKASWCLLAHGSSEHQRQQTYYAMVSDVDIRERINDPGPDSSRWSGGVLES